MPLDWPEDFTLHGNNASSATNPFWNELSASNPFLDDITQLRNNQKRAVKTLPAMQESRVRSQGRGDPLEKEMAIHSSIFAWEISWTEEPGGLQFMESYKSLSYYRKGM